MTKPLAITRRHCLTAAGAGEGRLLPRALSNSKSANPDRQGDSKLVI